RGTPTVEGGALYLIRGNGDLHCLDAATGKPRWKKGLVDDLGGQLMSGWGYSESPLGDGENVICVPGGGKGAIAAFNKKTGELVWRCKELKDAAAYSSLIFATVDGVKQYITLTGSGVAGVSSDGKLLWRFNRPGYRTAVIPTAIYHDGYVY